MNCNANPWTSYALLVLPLLTFCVVGCSSQPELLPASGTVTYRGEPLRFGFVMFQPTTGQMSQAEIQPDGTFELATFEPGDGAPEGSYRVSVLCYESHDPNGAGLQENEGGGILLGKSLIPTKYSRASSSGLTAEIKPGQENVFSFELEGSSSR